MNLIYILICKVKYIIYFNIFIYVLLVNYLHYKLWNVSNNKLVHLLNYTIKLNGCVIIKLIQWLNTNIEMMLINSKNTAFLSKLFSQFYEDCPIHKLKYTKDLFLEDFGVTFDSSFELDNTFLIKSGSIAQVYKGIMKKNNTCVAIKVVHPELEYQLICPINFVRLYSYLVSNFKCFKKYDIVVDLNSFFCNLEKQISMENEFVNNEYFYNNYSNNIVIIPKPLMKSKNFLIMEYVEGQPFEDLDISEYKKQMIISYMSIFIKDTFINGKYVHCDLHQANWKVYTQPNTNNELVNNYKIIIYDFGYVIENEVHDTLKKIVYYLDVNNIYKLGNLLFNNIKNINCDISNISNYREDFIQSFKKHNITSYPYSDNILISSVNFLYVNGYKLNDNLLDFFISGILINKHLKKYIFLNYDISSFDEDIYYKYIYNINMHYISICEKHDVFHNVKQYLYDTYINNSFFSEKITYTNTNKYFNSLKNGDCDCDCDLSLNTTIDI